MGAVRGVREHRVRAHVVRHEVPGADREREPSPLRAAGMPLYEAQHVRESAGSAIVRSNSRGPCRRCFQTTRGCEQVVPRGGRPTDLRGDLRVPSAALGHRRRIAASPRSRSRITFTCVGPGGRARSDQDVFDLSFQHASFASSLLDIGKKHASVWRNVRADFAVRAKWCYCRYGGGFAKLAGIVAARGDVRASERSSRSSSVGARLTIYRSAGRWTGGICSRVLWLPEGGRTVSSDRSSRSRFTGFYFRNSRQSFVEDAAAELAGVALRVVREYSGGG